MEKIKLSGLGSGGSVGGAVRRRLLASHWSDGG